LQDKRAEVVAVVYGALSRLRFAANVYLRLWNPDAGPDLESRRKEAFAAYNFLSDHFYPNEIYLPRDTATRIDQMRSAYADVFVDFGDHHLVPLAERSKLRQELRERLNKLSVDALNELKSDFRKLAGDDS
jgi:hypothetical protein